MGYPSCYTISLEVLWQSYYTCIKQDGRVYGIVKHGNDVRMEERLGCVGSAQLAIGL